MIAFIKEQDSKFIFLALMLAFLPNFEVPKNIFVVFFVISWLLLSIKNKSWGGRWRVIDTVFLLWIIADIVVGINAVLMHDQPANGSRDIIKFVLVGWVISRSEFTVRQVIYLCIVAILFSIIPLSYIYINCNGGACISLNSVGHVNHTAIFLLIIYAISLSLLIFNFNNIGNILRSFLLFTTVLLAYVVIDTHSRAVTGLIVLVTLLAMLYAIYLYRNWCSAVISILIILLTSTIFVYNTPPAVNRLIDGSNLTTADQSRQQIRNFSYYLFKIDPMLGTGMSNFPNFSHKDIKGIVIKDVGKYDQNKFKPYAHPHNVYLAYLTGGGILLFSIFIWFWLQVVNIIYRLNKAPEYKWLIFNGSGVVLIVLGIGLVNTTLAHEHGLIAMFVLGMLISMDRKTSKK